MMVRGPVTDDIKYAWCGYWSGVCKAVIADIPEQQEFTISAVREWVALGADTIRRLPVDLAKEELRL
jgi:hypothetical protein